MFIYKRERGFDVHDASIAVVIQAQIAAEVAGVGFSVDPISNDYDHAVFNANWGLGETVVSGLATPDRYVVDKVSGQLIASTVGAKETATWLLPDGGTEERPRPRSRQRRFRYAPPPLAPMPPPCFTNKAPGPNTGGGSADAVTLDEVERIIL